MAKKARRIVERKIVGEMQSISASVGNFMHKVTVDNDRDYVILSLVITPSTFTSGDYVEIFYEGEKLLQSLYMDGSSIEVEFGEKVEELRVIKRKTQPIIRYYNVAAQAKTVYYDFTRGYLGAE